MTRDYGPAPRSAPVVALLDAAQAGALVHLGADRFKRLARRDPVLLVNTIRIGGKALWHPDTIRRWLDEYPRGVEPQVRMPWRKSVPA